MCRVTECELNVRPGAFHQLPERFALITLNYAIQQLIYCPEAFYRDGGYKRLLVGKMRVGCCMADACFLRNLAQAQAVDSVFGKDFNSRLNQGVL